MKNLKNWWSNFISQNFLQSPLVGAFDHITAFLTLTWRGSSDLYWGDNKKMAPWGHHHKVKVTGRRWHRQSKKNRDVESSKEVVTPFLTPPPPAEDNTRIQLEGKRRQACPNLIFSLEFCDRYLGGLTLIPHQFIGLKRKKKKISG